MLPAVSLLCKVLQVILPDKLARFVSFVNAPGSPDPTVQFEQRDGRKVPVLLGSPAMPARV